MQICFGFALIGMVAAAAARDDQPQRIVAVADLHGDWEAWVAIARAAKLVDGRNRWAGGPTTFVQLGDIADRGPDSLKIIRHLRQLQREAPRSGGRVVVLVGNHEAMNVTGDLRYVHPGEFAAFADRDSERRRADFYERNRISLETAYRLRSPSANAAQLRALWLADTPLGWVEHRLAWRPGGVIGRWVAGNPAVVLIGGNLFVHGGLSAEYSALSLGELNRRVSAALSVGDSEISSIINDPLGPLWYRGNVSRSATVTAELGLSPLATGAVRPSVAEELGQILAIYGARRLIVGHTPSLAGINVTQGGQLVQVDTGIARHYGGAPAYLEIIGDRLIPHTVERPAAVPRER